MEALWTKTNSEADLFLLNNEILSDVKFVFPNCENKEIYGHTFFLSKKSPVFHTMFHGSMKEGSTVKIEDSSDKTFLELLKYIYTEIVYLTEKNVLELQYLANKYLIKNLQEECVKFIEKNTDKILGKENTDKEIVKYLLSLDKVNCNEKTIFTLIFYWAKAFCSKNNEELSSLKELFHLIRFPTMNSVEFGECIKMYRDLFSTEEIGEIFLYISTKTETKNESKRCLDLKIEKRTLMTDPYTEKSVNIECLHNNNMRWINIQLQEPGFIKVKILKNCFLTYLSFFKKNGGELPTLDFNIIDEIKKEIVYKGECECYRGQFYFGEDIYFEKDITYKIEFADATGDEYCAFTPLYKTYDSLADGKNVLTITSSYHNIIKNIVLTVLQN